MKYTLFLLLTASILILQSCSSTKFVPDGQYLLSTAKVKSDTKAISDQEMDTYIKQKPNYKTFSLIKVPLLIYNLSGHDTTKWVNKTLRNAGEPPVLYDSTMTDKTLIDLKRIMTNKGYLDADVSPEVELKDKRAKVTYNIKAGKPFIIDSYNIQISDSIIDTKIFPKPLTERARKAYRLPKKFPTSTDSVLHWHSLVKQGNLFDLDVLDQERDRITSVFRRTGYYDFDKEYIGFVADTLNEEHHVSLDLSIYPYAQRSKTGDVVKTPHKRFIVNDVSLYIDYNPLVEGSISEYIASGIYEKDGFRILYGPKGKYIKPNILLNNCFIRPGDYYNEEMTSMTYSVLSQLDILKNVNITYTEFIENDSTKLHCIITCVPDKKQGISAELEGTNSGGALGVETGIGYLHRNAFKGSELFAIKLRGAYEAVSSNFSRFDKNYFEIGGETSLTIPRLMVPFLGHSLLKRLHATTQFTTNYTFQRRPDFFTRTVLSSGIKYNWQDRRNSAIKHTLNLVEVSYVHIPTLSSRFDSTLTASAKQYSFTDQFILGTGYTFTKTNINTVNKLTHPIYSFRASIESAGNLLSLIAKAAGTERDDFGSRKIFGTQYAQYLRGILDYSQTIRLDDKNSIAWHMGGGVAYPYGNFKEIPIQKRFFSGGSNSVRGWGIRELGPGASYTLDKNEDNFFFHSGEMRLDASIEYRSKLFWIIELGAFIDAGNIWNVKKYDNQKDANFDFSRFYKEIAVAWGLGIRLDFDFVLLRLDCGWKAYDPTNDPRKKKWPIKKPWDIKSNTAWHIAVGYPF